MAVSGAYITPLIAPAIPTNTRFVTGTSVNPMCWHTRAKRYPKVPPAKREGAKFPPFPPLNMVKDVAKAFNNRTSTKNMIIVHSPISKYLKRLFSIMEWVFPLVKAFTVSYPSPNKGGNNTQSRESTAPEHGFTHFRKLKSFYKMFYFLRNNNEISGI